MMCFAAPGSSTPMCTDCTEEGNDCSWDEPDCCAGLSCYVDTCKRCVLETASCENEEGAVPCCGTATCFAGPDSTVTYQP